MAKVSSRQIATFSGRVTDAVEKLVKNTKGTLHVDHPVVKELVEVIEHFEEAVIKILDTDLPSRT